MGLEGKTYKIGDVVHLTKNDKTIPYRVGSAIGKWDICLKLPGIGTCGLYRVNPRTELEDDIMGDFVISPVVDEEKAEDT